MDTCSICCDTIDPTDNLCKLSCGHTFHLGCVKKLMFYESHSFVKCPLCREVNVTSITDLLVRDTSLTSLTPLTPLTPLSAKDTLALWFHQESQCIHLTKKGTRCSHKPQFMNGGCCQKHSKYPLHPQKYELYVQYMQHIFETTNRWSTKIYMLDISRKLLHRFPEITTALDLQHYFLRFFHTHSTRVKEFPVVCSGDFYRYYELELPCREWTKYNVKQRVFL